MKFTATTLGMLLVLAMFTSAAADDKDNLGAQLIGSYSIVSGEKFGEIIPAENLRESAKAHHPARDNCHGQGRQADVRGN